MLEEIAEKFTDEEKKAIEKAVYVIMTVLTKGSGSIKRDLLKALGIFTKTGAYRLSCILASSDVVDFDDADEVALSLNKDELRTEVIRRLSNKGFFKKERHDVSNIEKAIKVHSFLRVATVFMDSNQRQWFVERIVLFTPKTHSSVVATFLKSFAILDDNKVAQIMQCLEDGECRTELVKIMSERGFT